MTRISLENTAGFLFFFVRGAACWSYPAEVNLQNLNIERRDLLTATEKQTQFCCLGD